MLIGGRMIYEIEKSSEECAKGFQKEESATFVGALLV